MTNRTQQKTVYVLGAGCSKNYEHPDALRELIDRSLQHAITQEEVEVPSALGMGVEQRDQSLSAGAELPRRELEIFSSHPIVEVNELPIWDNEVHSVFV